jgi:WD40 repeat protein
LLNDEETQGRFAEFLAGLARSGFHVLLSMRDDFLIRCHAQPALAPVFDKLTPVLPLEGAALRRALTEPARASGYRFEDESLVAEILTEVSRERGALPILAFAASKLWEKRDREERRLTREAYLSIGGVAGSLAKHAEDTLSGIGLEREPIVREIFRYLTTGSGTRVPAAKEELLTVFEDRDTAERVLSKLIDARLLTTAGREVEVIHESLLTAWPRLVRWQTQDADGAVLRDQLRQAARAWVDRGRPDDLLWRGTAYREYRVWRERYSGGLSELEAAFARTMEALATRQRRKQRVALIAIVVSLVAGLTTVGALWRRAEQAHRQTQAEARNREAAQLLALGQQRLDKDPTQALAYALASLERLDNDPARRFAVEALWRGPTRSGVRMDSQWIRFSPDGQWLATSSQAGVWLFSREGGPGQKLSSTWDGIAFTRDGRHLVIREEKSVRLFELAAALESRRIALEEKASFFWTIVGDELVDFLASAPPPWPGAPPGPYLLKSWPLDGGEPRNAGQWEGRARGFDVDPVRRRIAWLESGNILSSSLATPNDERIIGRHEGAVELWFRQDGRSLVSVDPSREIRIWTTSEDPVRRLHAVRIPGQISPTFADARYPVDLDARGRFLAATTFDGTEQALRLWDLAGPRHADPLTLRNLHPDTFKSSPWISFQQEGTWLASSHGDLMLWPLTGKRAYVFRWPEQEAGLPHFSPDGRFLVASCEKDALCSWPLTAEAGEVMKVLGRGGPFWSYVFDPAGRFLVTGGQDGLAVRKWPGGTPRVLETDVDIYDCVPAIGGGRFALCAANPEKPGSVVVRVWDLASGAEHRLDPNVPGENCAPDGMPPGFILSIAFLPDGRLLSEGFSGLRLWDVERGSSEKLGECVRDESFLFWNFRLTMTPDGRYAVSMQNSGDKTHLKVYDLEQRTSREITSHGESLTGLALDPSGRTIVTGDREGVVRIGPVSGEEPHLLYGHSASARFHLEVSPDGRWVVSLGRDRRLRLWPMPNGRPLHTLPYEELLARLRRLTNLRVVPDAVAPSGYRVDLGPFPGWSTLPEW